MHALDRSKIIETVKTSDLIVCGGGTAGIAAAVSAAARGLKVIIIEKETFLGGTMTGALVQPFMNNHADAELTTWLNPHFQELLIAEMKNLTTATGCCDNQSQRAFDPILLTIALENIAVAHGIDIWYSTTLIGCNLKNGSISSILVSNKSGLIELNGRIFADCTADLDLGVMCGLDFYDGTGSENKHQAISLRFTMSNVNMNRAMAFFEEKKKENILGGWIEKQTPKGVMSYMYKLFPDAEKWDNAECNQFYIIPGRTGEVNFNCPEIHGYDGTNGEDVSHVLIELRKKILRLRDNMIKYFPGFEESYISAIAPNLGIRDTKRLKGLYTFTEEDVVNGSKFDDGVVMGNYGIDIHIPGFSEAVNGKHRPDANDYYEIPYRCLISGKIDNYITAGRTMSSTFRGLAAARILNIVTGMGWAAGIAASLAVRENKKINSLDGSSVRKLIFAPPSPK
ncbi:MAG: FAD-dependent oxidoreductase [Lentisphaerota bacterium]